MDLDAVLDLERPHPRLLKLYLLRCLVFPPFSLLALPFFYFRYQTLRYAFDEEGVTLSWGVLFRKEISLGYARIQDIHLTSGLFQRWLGLADIHIQTASGSAKAEMTIEGLLEFELVRDFLYSKMRGVRGGTDRRPSPSIQDPPSSPAPITGAGQAEIVLALREVAAELRATRQALERSADPPAGGSLEGGGEGRP